jgi:hypothetical protein
MAVHPKARHVGGGPRPDGAENNQVRHAIGDAPADSVPKNLNVHSPRPSRLNAIATGRATRLERSPGLTLSDTMATKVAAHAAAPCGSTDDSASAMSAAHETAHRADRACRTIANAHAAQRAAIRADGPRVAAPNPVAGLKTTIEAPRTAVIGEWENPLRSATKENAPAAIRKTVLGSRSKIHRQRMSTV